MLFLKRQDSGELKLVGLKAPVKVMRDKKAWPTSKPALNTHPETAEMGRILSGWDFHDDADKAAPAIFQVTYRLFARMTFHDELGDPEKVLAVLPGGVSGRLFHPNTKNQIKLFISGEKVYWWFSDKAIQSHTQSTLVLNP